MPAELRGGSSSPSSLTSTAKSMACGHAGDAGLRRLIPRLRARHSAARAFERTQARSRFSFGAGGLAFLDLGSELIDHSQKMTAAAIQIAEK